MKGVEDSGLEEVRLLIDRESVGRCVTRARFTSGEVVPQGRERLFAE
jgi:hypothetical protein